MFMWLINKSALFTWPTVQTKGWSGPKIYCLYKKTGEDIRYVMLYCKFSVQLWQKYSTYFNKGLDMRMTDNVRGRLSLRDSVTFINTVVTTIC